MRVPSQVLPHKCIYRLVFLIFAVFTLTINAVLPTEFDPFLEVLFETIECEPFLAEAKYISVSTSECQPYICDFPRQMCMREAARHTDESANECISIPTSCLTAANGGIPVGPGAPHIVTTRPPRVFGGIVPGGRNPGDQITGNGRPSVKLVTTSLIPPVPPPPPDRFLPRLGPNQHGDICQQGVPQGRFCGFQLKFTYNKETENCEQFWFPGCATEQTNDNLFGGEQDCKIATLHCSTGPATTTTERPIRIRRPTTLSPPKTIITEAPLPDYPDSKEIPQPPPPPENRRGGFGSHGSGGGVDLSSLAGSLMSGSGGSPGGIVSQFLGSGLGGGGASSSVVPSGYGGNFLGASGGGGRSGGGGNGANFIGLIANAVKQVSNKPVGGATAGGASTAVQWLKNIDAGQITNLFSSLFVF